MPIDVPEGEAFLSPAVDFVLLAAFTILLAVGVGVLLLAPI